MQLLEFLKVIGKLKKIKRSGFSDHGITTVESVAGHAFRASLINLVLAKRFGLDESKCVKLALIHDLAECFSDDEGLERHAHQQKALDQLSTLAQDDSLSKLWDEYESGSSPEARFVRDVDVFEMILQAKDYAENHPDKDLNAFFDKHIGEIKDARLRALLN